MKAANDSIGKIKSHFQNAVNLEQNCKIYVCAAQNDSWSFYFKRGNLVWASSSNHRFRRLYRSIALVCPNVNCHNTKLREQEISELWEYLFLNVLYKREQITQTETKQIIQEIIKEVLFDCLISEAKIEQTKIIFETKGNQMGAILNSPLFNHPITHLNYGKAIHRLESLVADWKNLQIGGVIPNLAPVIKDIDKLKKAVVDGELYQQLFVFINGKRTIRDLVVVSKHDLITLVNHLLPHLKNKTIALQEIPDLQLTNLYFSPTSQEIEVQYAHTTREYIQELNLPLVICVDDDAHICQYITKLLNPVGYRTISINNAVKTLIVLLDNIPNLIFIDASMPNVNGYELCAQIKRMPAFKNIPIVILSEQEGIINTFRWRMSGATDIISKPLNSNEVLTIAQKYTQSFIDNKILSIFH